MTLRYTFRSPEVAYNITINFLKWAPNITFSIPIKAASWLIGLDYLPQLGESVLVIDAGNTTLADASGRIEEWKEAVYKISATICSKSHAGSQETQVPTNEGLLIRLSGVIVCVCA